MQVKEVFITKKKTHIAYQKLEISRQTVLSEGQHQKKCTIIVAMVLVMYLHDTRIVPI